MNTADAREAFIRACEKAEHAEPVHLPMNTPVTVGSVRFRAVYDVSTDTVGFITETEWRARLEKARANAVAAGVGRSYAAALRDGPVARGPKLGGWVA